MAPRRARPPGGEASRSLRERREMFEDKRRGVERRLPPDLAIVFARPDAAQITLGKKRRGARGDRQIEWTRFEWARL